MKSEAGSIGSVSTLKFGMVKDEASRLSSQKERLAVNYIDYESFKAAIVRLTILGGNVLGGEDSARLKTKIELEEKL
jgi:hypothetical protein